MWNLIPADASFNLKKGDKLPDFDQYFDSFFEIQKDQPWVLVFLS